MKHNKGIVRIIFAVQETKSVCKLGRPIMHDGDPFAPGLTLLERRIRSRRIANRNSARRVRVRRQGQLDDLISQVRQKEFTVPKSVACRILYTHHTHRLYVTLGVVVGSCRSLPNDKHLAKDC